MTNGLWLRTKAWAGDISHGLETIMRPTPIGFITKSTVGFTVLVKLRLQLGSTIPNSVGSGLVKSRIPFLSTSEDHVGWLYYKASSGMLLESSMTILMSHGLRSSKNNL